VLTRGQLLESVWGWDYAGQSQIVETYVSYLRRKLDPLGPPLIHTQRGVGYSLRATEPQTPGPPPEPGSPGPQPPEPQPPGGNQPGEPGG
jgi:two-component system OmpR family response regulator